MSFASLLTHDLVHVRQPFDDRVASRDSEGQPARLPEVRTAVKGLVQPRSGATSGGGAELADFRSAGSLVADHVIFLLPMTLDGSDWFEYAGDRYDVVTPRSFAFGGTPHLEVDVRRVHAAAPADSLSEAP